MRVTHDPGAAPSRLVSLDQFRGYTIAGMFLVNFIGNYRAAHPLLDHHNTYCSYADTIMPHFFFAVGCAFRLTFLRERAQHGAAAAVRHALVRNLSLLAIGAAVYGYDAGPKTWEEVRALGVGPWLSATFGGVLFQTLVHIAVTSLWVLPVIGGRSRVLVGFAAASALLHLGLSQAFWYEWTRTHRTIDGGPLGFLTWTVPVVAGALAYDAIAARGARGAVRPLMVWGAVLMLGGYALSCLNPVSRALAAEPLPAGIGAWLAAPPFVPPGGPVDLWTMSQKAGSLSYLAFGAGLSLAVYAAFVLVCDLGARRLRLFETLGQNALLAYLIHSPIAAGVQSIVPRDAPLWFVLLGLGLFFAVTWGVMRTLEKNRIYLKL
ncbi:MAG: hypothetical protein HZA54_01880 [Planctomycetes bacterium]|nr:hypothetical protein [Planctomycetota bacterium]